MQHFMFSNDKYMILKKGGKEKKTMLYDH